MANKFAAISAQQEMMSASSSSLSEQEALMYQQQNVFALQENSQNLGWLGKAFGSAQHAPTNIAGLTVMFGFAGLLLIVICPIDKAIAQSLRELFGGLMLAALGYLFGAKKS